VLPGPLRPGTALRGRPRLAARTTTPRRGVPAGSAELAEPIWEVRLLRGRVLRRPPLRPNPLRFARGPGLRGGAPAHPARLLAAARHDRSQDL